MNVDDRNFLLDILNYDMKPIFTSLGFNVEGGDFVYAHKDKVDTQEMLNVVKGMKEMTGSMKHSASRSRKTTTSRRKASRHRSRPSVRAFREQGKNPTGKSL